MTISNARWAAALVCLACSVAYAQEAPVGYVKTAKGDAVLVTSNAEIKAEVGTPVRVGNIIRTGANGSLGVTLKDNTVMSFGPRSEVVVDAFAFAPASNDLKLGVKITKGTMLFVSGVIAKLKPEAVAVATPSATAGVRGTRFVVSVEQ